MLQYSVACKGSYVCLSVMSVDCDYNEKWKCVHERIVPWLPAEPNQVKSSCNYCVVSLLVVQVMYLPVTGCLCVSGIAV